MMFWIAEGWGQMPPPYTNRLRTHAAVRTKRMLREKAATANTLHRRAAATEAAAAALARPSPSTERPGDAKTPKCLHNEQAAERGRSTSRRLHDGFGLARLEVEHKCEAGRAFARDLRGLS